MIKYAGYIFCVFIVFALPAQSLYVSGTSSINVSANATLISDDAIIAGSVVNNGELYFNANVDFGDNASLGNVILGGSTPLILSGSASNLQFHSLKITNEAEIILAVDSIKTDQLILEKGIVSTGLTYFESSSNITGGSSESYIDSKLTIARPTENNILFPIGKDGHYNPIQLKNVPLESTTTVYLQDPDPTSLIPGDSVIGIADEYEWVISYSGPPATLTPQIQFNGIDLSNFSIEQPIRAPSYQPGIVIFDSLKSAYRSLGLRFIDETDSRTFGTVESLHPFEISNEDIRLGIGLTPFASELQFYIPTLFAPKSEFKENRLFRPFLVGTKIESLDLKIWDQFNKMIFNQFYRLPKLENVGWNGRVDGDDAPEGSYYYSVVLQTEDGTFERKGTVFLAR